MLSVPPGVGLSRAAGTPVELEVTGVHGDCQYPKVFTCCPDPVGLEDATGKDFTRVIQSVSERPRGKDLRLNPGSKDTSRMRSMTSLTQPLEATPQEFRTVLSHKTPNSQPFPKGHPHVLLPALNIRRVFGLSRSR